MSDAEPSLFFSKQLGCSRHCLSTSFGLRHGLRGLYPHGVRSGCELHP